MAEKNNLQRLAEISRYFGKKPDFVLAGGGNTSFKDENTIYVKASGTSLACVSPEDFVALDRKQLREITSKRYPSDPRLREEHVKIDLLSARIFPERGQRPSVESNFHELIDYPWVVHLHPCVVNALTCSKDGKKHAGSIFGDEALWAGYTDPGYKLAISLRKALSAWKRKKGKHPGIILMQNHGIIAAGDSPVKVRNTVLNAVSLIAGRIEEKIPPHVSERERTVSPSMRDSCLTLRGAFGSRRKIVYPVDLKGIEGILDERTGPMTPDQVVYCRPEILRIPGEKLEFEAVSRMIDSYESRRGYPPALLLVEGTGIFGAGDDFASARNSANAFWDMARTIIASRSFGGARFLSAKESSFIDSWEVESYRRKSSSTAPGELSGLTAVVTGSARGVGKGIAGALAGKGVHVVIADINGREASAAAAGICEAFGENRAFPFEADITDEKTVESLFERAVSEYGGVDLLINNAGILISGSIEDLEYKDFRKVIDINLNASFLCAKKAAGIMIRQKRGDIIQMSSKSGKTGSRNNSAYASSKFAAIGLAQSLAMDLAEHNIFVNALCPGNFLDLDLWQSPGGLFDQYLKAGKVPGARTRKDVEAHYRKQTLLGRGCTVEDIVETILYILRQRGETGQAYNITQGQTLH